MQGVGRSRSVRGAPSRKTRLLLTGAVVLVGGVGIAVATAGSSDGDDSSRIGIGTAVTEPAPAAAGSSPDGDTGSSGTDQPAPAGSSPGVWWRPAADQYGPSLLWVFDPSTNSGYQKEYQPIGIDGPVEYQHTFTYGPTGSGVRLSFLSVMTGTSHEEDLTSLRYDTSDGVLRVDRDGSSESWFGCSSGAIPAPAAVLC